MGESIKQDTLHRQVPQMKAQIRLLCLENVALLPIKIEIARLRASMADAIYSLSEEIK